MPIRTSIRWAWATCSADSPINVSGVPQGINHPT